MKIARVLAIGMLSFSSSAFAAADATSDENFIKTSVATEILKGEARFKMAVLPTAKATP